MNERIDQLLVKAGAYFGGEGVVYDRFDPKKFAELLVKECAQVSEDDITDGDACCTNTADRIARQIKKHFGVEE